MPFKYQSGEEIRGGDRVVFGGEPAKIDFVVTEASGDPALDWYLEQFPAGGFMVTTDKGVSFFLHNPEDDEDLEFVSRSLK